MNRYVYIVTTRPDSLTADEECMDHIHEAFDSLEVAMEAYTKIMNQLQDDGDNQMKVEDLVVLTEDSSFTVLRDIINGSIVRILKVRVFPLT